MQRKDATKDCSMKGRAQTAERRTSSGLPAEHVVQSSRPAAGSRALPADGEPHTDLEGFVIKLFPDSGLS